MARDGGIEALFKRDIGFATKLIRSRGAYAARTVILAMVVPHEGSPAPIYRYFTDKS